MIVVALQLPAMQDADGRRHVLHVFGALLRRHQHFFDQHVAASIDGACLARRLGLRRSSANTARFADRDRTRSGERSFEPRAAQQPRQCGRWRELTANFRRAPIAYELRWRGDDHIRLSGKLQQRLRQGLRRDLEGALRLCRLRPGLDGCEQECREGSDDDSNRQSHE